MEVRSVIIILDEWFLGLADEALFFLDFRENMFVMIFFGLSDAGGASITPLLLHIADQLHRIEVVLVEVTVLSCLVLDHVCDGILYSGQGANINRLLDLRVDGVCIAFILEHVTIHLELVEHL